MCKNIVPSPEALDVAIKAQAKNILLTISVSATLKAPNGGSKSSLVGGDGRGFLRFPLGISRCWIPALLPTLLPVDEEVAAEE